MPTTLPTLNPFPSPTPAPTPRTEFVADARAHARAHELTLAGADDTPGAESVSVADARADARAEFVADAHADFCADTRTDGAPDRAPDRVAHRAADTVLRRRRATAGAHAVLRGVLALDGRRARRAAAGASAARTCIAKSGNGSCVASWQVGAACPLGFERCDASEGYEEIADIALTGGACKRYRGAFALVYEPCAADGAARALEVAVDAGANLTFGACEAGGVACNLTRAPGRGGAAPTTTLVLRGAPRRARRRDRRLCAVPALRARRRRRLGAAARREAATPQHDGARALEPRADLHRDGRHERHALRLVRRARRRARLAQSPDASRRRDAALVIDDGVWALAAGATARCGTTTRRSPTRAARSARRRVPARRAHGDGDARLRARRGASVTRDVALSAKTLNLDAASRYAWVEGYRAAARAAPTVSGASAGDGGYVVYFLDESEADVIAEAAAEAAALGLELAVARRRRAAARPRLRRGRGRHRRAARRGRDGRPRAVQSERDRKLDGVRRRARHAGERPRRQPRGADALLLRAAAQREQPHARAQLDGRVLRVLSR